MSLPNFIVTPLTTTVCGTCAKWEGARILQDGNCHSMTDSVGFCLNCPDKDKKHRWQLPVKMAPEVACEAWNVAQ